MNFKVLELLDSTDRVLQVVAEQHDPDETLAGDAGGAAVDGTWCENRAESDANDYAAVVATVAETTAADRSSSLAESGDDDSGSGSGSGNDDMKVWIDCTLTCIQH